MRKRRPFIHLEKLRGELNKFRIHALIYLEDDQEINPKKLLPKGVKKKQRDLTHSHSSYINCTKFEIDIRPKPGTKNTAPQYLVSDPFVRDIGIDHIWVEPIIRGQDVGGSPEEGGVGNYDDPDGDV